MRVAECADFFMQYMLEDVKGQGQATDPRGNGTLEVLGWQGMLNNPRARLQRNPIRDLRNGYAAASVAWNLAERNDPSILYWNPNGKWILENDEFYGANYGQRLLPYLHEAMYILTADPSSRRAWVPIWTPQDLIDLEGRGMYSRDGKDVPCTLGFGLRLTSGMNGPNSKLDFHVVMRSQSIGVAPYDLFFFTVLQELVANTMDKDLGRTFWSCNSLHYYDNEATQRLAELDWYHAKRFKQNAAIDAQFIQLMQRPMDHIDLTLGEATSKWPQFMDGIMSNLDVEATDPLERLMLSGKPREGEVVAEGFIGGHV